VPAVEVDAREEWERESDGGTDIVCARSFGFGPCPACRTRARAEVERDKGGEAGEIAELETYRARGLFGISPGNVTVRPEPFDSAPTALRSGQAESKDEALTRSERADLAARFRCPDCGGKGLELGRLIARHACPAPADAARVVAWRGYDGSMVTLGWWAAKRA
jgi:hypothetical protein